MKTKTWLPLFSGFYGTIWETDNDEEMEIENINELRREKNMPPITWDDIEWDYSEYTKTVSQMFTAFVEAELQKLGVVSKLRYEKLVSPREYNFTNDSVNVTATFMKKNLVAIEKYLAEHKAEFAEYVNERYSSRSGFISYYSNDAGAWVAEGIPALMSDDHKAGAVLNFILTNEGIEEMDAYEDINGNGGTLYAKNYSELVPA